MKIGWLGQPVDAYDDAAGDRPRPARRAVWVLALVAVGFTIARHAAEVESVLWFSCASGALAVAAAARGWACRIALGLGVVLLAGGWFQLRVHERTHGSLARWVEHDPLAEPAVVRVAGMVLDTARERRFEGRPRVTGFELAARRAEVGGEWAAVRGVVRVWVEGSAETLPAFVSAGAIIEVTGRLRAVSPAMNPGEVPRELFAAQDGLVGTLAAPSADLIVRSDAGGSLDGLRGTLLGAVAALRDSVRRTIGGDGRAGAEAPHVRGRALIAAMLLGEREPGGQLDEVESAFRRVGLVHLVAISGFNLAVLAWLALVAVRATGDRGWVEPVVCGAIIGMYLLILPGESPILRSGIGLLVFLGAEASGRRYDRVSVLGWIAVGLLALSPMDLWSLGFQLSFGVVGALMLLSGRVHERLWGLRVRGLVLTPAQRRLPRRAGAWVAERLKLAVTASLVAWVIATPLIAHHTGLVSPLAPVASLVMIPLVSVILWIGYGCVLLGLLVPPLSDAAATALGWLGEGAVLAVSSIDEWPGASLYLPRLSGAWAAAATVAVVYWLVRGRWRDWAAWVGTAAVIGWMAVAMTLGVRLDRAVAARVDVLAVGEGSCVLVRSGDDAVLVGCGAAASRPRAEDVVRAVRELGVWRVRAVVVPDAREEFWSLVPGLAGSLRPRAVLLTRKMVDGALLDSNGGLAGLMRSLTTGGVAMRVIGPGDAFAVGGAVVRVVGDGGQGLVMRVETAGRAVLLAQASTHTAVEALPGDDRRADAVVLPRTLRSGERAGETLRAVGAEVAVHAAGARHARELLAQTGEAGVMAAALHGCVTVEITTDGRVRVR